MLHKTWVYVYALAIHVVPINFRLACSYNVSISNVHAVNTIGHPTFCYRIWPILIPAYIRHSRE